MTQPAPPEDWRALLVRLRWPLALVLLAALALWGYRETLRTLDQAAERAEGWVDGALEGARQAAEGFWTGEITERFVASMPRIEGTGAGLLELARLEVTETFTRTDERRVGWDLFSLGTTVTEIQVPVTYRYHLRLADPWQLDVSEQQCLVYAPSIRPSQPPAIHTDRMQKRIDEGWLRFDAAEQLAAMEQSLTPRLTNRASSPGHLDLVREESRRTVATFVRDWLIQEEQWRADGIRAIRVVFPDDEPEPAGAMGLTVVLEQD